jgi:hypothetical protein
MSSDASGSSGASSSSNSGSGIAAQASAAIDQFRSVGKWIIASFAAVATLLLAGIQLTSIGSADTPRLIVACIGLTVAVIAVILAIGNLTSLLEPHVSGPDNAAADADNPHTPLGKFTQDHHDLLFPSGIANATELLAEFNRLRSMTPRDTADEKKFQNLRRSLTDLVWWSSYEDAKERFDRSRNWTMVAAGVVAVGATLYAWAATSPNNGESASPAASPSAAVEPTPVTVVLKLNPAGRTAFSGVLGSRCIAAASSSKGVLAIALSADTSQTTVVLIPTPTVCPMPTRISVPLNDGIAIPVTSVKPAVSPTQSSKPKASQSSTR